MVPIAGPGRSRQKPPKLGLEYKMVGSSRPSAAGPRSERSGGDYFLISSNVNFWPPIEASAIRPPLVAVMTATPLL